ncbi:hypothetical protein [Streptomyces sp. cmx-18-6]|uniref:hypothetical protein n=1 Tax=Streptomyces sp. cmx-18-6 TaxID=2790930 RepID=UPI00397E9852
MDHYADAVIAMVVGALERQAAARGLRVDVLQSVRELAANDEAEIALDYLVHAVNSSGLTLSQDQYDRLRALALRLEYSDVLTDIRPERLTGPERSSP